MICPSCGKNNLPGQDRCTRCSTSLMQLDVPQADTPARWRIMVDPISSLEPSTIAPQIVDEDEPLSNAIARMQEKNVGYVLVTGEGGRLTGILTEHDVLCRVFGQVDDLESTSVAAVMSRDPTSLHAEAPIAHALHFMAMNDFMYIPVIDEAGRPVDLLSFRRVIRLIEQME